MDHVTIAPATSHQCFKDRHYLVQFGVAFGQIRRHILPRRCIGLGCQELFAARKNIAAPHDAHVTATVVAVT